jgi:hypothetical protein
MAATSMIVRDSWRKTGFGFVRRNRTDHLRVREDKIRSIPEFQDVSMSI